MRSQIAAKLAAASLPLGLSCALFAGELAAQESTTEVRPQSEEPATEEMPPELRTVVDALRALRDPEAPPPAEIAPGILGEARAVRGELLGFLLERRIPDPEGKSPQILSEVQRELVLELFARMPAYSVHASVDLLLETESSARRHEVAILALGAVGESRDLVRVLSLAEEVLAVEAAHTALGAIRWSVTNILELDAEGFRILKRRWFGLDPALLPEIVRAVGATEDGRGLELLARIANHYSELELVCLAQMRRVGPSPSEKVNRQVLAQIRPLLDPEDPARCRAASLVLAELADIETLPALVELLGVPESGIAEDALWALRRLSGMSFPASPNLWKAWFEDELEWHRTESPRRIRQLQYADDATVIEAIASLAEHRLYRYELAPHLCEVLDHPSARIRELAARCLGQLGSERHVAELSRVSANELEDERVRAAAVEALRAVGS